jgi:DNA-binding SARP family transcriptional activator
MAFLDLAHRARSAARGGDPALAADLYEQALDLVQDPLFAGLDSSVLERPAFVALRRKRVTTAADAAGLAAGDIALVRCVPVLQRIAASAPLDEPLQARLMRVLSRTGRHAQALLLHEETRKALAEQLGTGPGPELRAAYQEALRASRP